MIRLTTQQRDAASETYEDVARLIASTAWQFVRRYGGDVEELIADGNSHFMRAYLAPSFDATKSKFSTWVRNVVWRGLHSDARRRRQSRSLPETLTAPEPRKMEWLEDLSEEAKTVVRLVIDMPDPLAEEVDRRGESPRTIRSVIRTYLAGIGWAGHQIASAFEEIGKAL